MTLTKEGAAEFVDEGPLTILTGLDEDGTATLQVSGEVDASTAPALRAAIEQAVADGCQLLCLDLGGIDFLDSTGISTLLAARTLLDGWGELRLTAISPAVERAIEVTGLNEFLTP